MVEVPSTWHPTRSDILSVDAEWKGQGFDGPLWRFEGLEAHGKNLEIRVSRISYRWHYVMRGMELKSRQSYPNPLSVNSLLETSDGYLVLGIKGHADQSGLGLVGSGFLDAVVEVGQGPTDWRIAPEDPFAAARREVQEEVMLIKGWQQGPPYNPEDLSILGTVYGSNHDTTIPVHFPLNCSRNEIAVGNSEHSRLLFLPVELSELDKFVATGELEGIKAVDHCVGSVALYLDFVNEIVRTDRFLAGNRDAIS